MLFKCVVDEARIKKLLSEFREKNNKGGVFSILWVHCSWVKLLTFCWKQMMTHKLGRRLRVIFVTVRSKKLVKDTKYYLNDFPALEIM